MAYGFYDDYEEPFPAPPAPPPPPAAGGPGLGPAGDIAKGGPPVNEPPVAGPGGGGGGGGGWALPGLPQFNIPKPPGFNPNAFARPTMEQARNEPGYQFRLNSGTDALERSAAAAGRLRTGGTLSDILEYGQNFGAQEYDRVFNRELQNYDRYYRGEHDKYAPLFAQWQLGAQGLRDAQSQRYNTELSHALQMGAPRSEPSLEELLGPPVPPPPAAPPGGGAPSGGNWWDDYTHPTGPYQQ